MFPHVSRRGFLQTSAVSSSVLATSPAVAESKPKKAPNVLFLMTDQHRFDSIGANQNTIIQTPHLDRLAATSANFSNAFVQAPVCVPARASFFTGRYAHAHRNRVNYTAIDPQTVLLPRRLQKAGYQTALIGKLHLFYRLPPSASNAQTTGFEIVELHDGTKITDPWSDYVKWRNQHDPRKQSHHYRDLARHDPEQAKTLKPGTNPFRCAIDEQYTDTTWTGLRTRATLQRLAQSDRPFFLFSSFWKPHSPFEVPRPFDALYNNIEFDLPPRETLATLQQLPVPLQKLILRGNHPPFDMSREQLQWIYRSYCGSITHIDREVGLILKTLENTGQAKNTIVVFTSDHGDQLLEHGLMGKNVFFESSIRVPLVMSFPDRIRPTQIDHLVETIDVLPTLLQFCGLPIPDDCHGQTLDRLIVGDSSSFLPRDAVFSENIIPEVITTKHLNFEFHPGQGIKGIRHPDAKMVRTDRWKFNYYPEGFAELYDLRNDPSERHNLATDAGYRSQVAELKGRILDWLITSTETDQIARRWQI